MATDISYIPQAAIAPFGEKVGISLFGRPFNWSLKTNFDGATEAIRCLVEGCDVTSIIAPRPDFSARVVGRKDLEEGRIIIPAKSLKFSDIPLLRGMPEKTGDGAMIFPGEAFFIASGDCPTLVMYSPFSGKLGCAHAGRDCLFDRAKLRGGAARKHESVVFALLDQFSWYDRSHIKAFITCGIGGESFRHSMIEGDRREENRAMINYIVATWGPHCVVGSREEGALSLKEVIRAQLLSAGISPDNIGQDSIDTYMDGDYAYMQNPGYRWWSNRRGDKSERNGVFVWYTK